MRFSVMGIAALCLVATACAAPVNRDSEVEKLLAADRAFDLASGDHGPAGAFDRFLTDDALQLPSNGPALKGRQQIVEAMAGDYSLRWQPQSGEVSEYGDMGYTWGLWQLILDTGADRRELNGKYLNVWVKRDGQWKVLVDLGNQASPLPESE